MFIHNRIFLSAAPLAASAGAENFSACKEKATQVDEFMV